MHSGSHDRVSARLPMQKSARGLVNIFPFLFYVQLPATDRGDRDRMGRGENRTRLNSFTAPASVCLLDRADIVFTAFSPLFLFLFARVTCLFHFPPSILFTSKANADNANLINYISTILLLLTKIKPYNGAASNEDFKLLKFICNLVLILEFLHSNFVPVLRGE